MNELCIFVEGEDDELFVKTIFDKLLNKRYNSYKVIKYGSMKKDKIKNYINSIESIKDSDYIFLSDQDGQVNKKEKILTNYKFLNTEKVFIAVYEIESWIIAGITLEKCREFGISRTERNPEKINKEIFNAIKPKRDTRLEIITKIYSSYDINEARNTSPSFKLFYYSLIEG